MPIKVLVLEGPGKGREHICHRYETLIVGRSPLASFSVPEDHYLSRNHFLLEFHPPQCCLRDLGSRNGTLVDNRRVEVEMLDDHAIIEAGDSKFQVLIETTAYRGMRHVTCRNCGKDAPKDVLTQVENGDSSGPLRWICTDCREHGRKYPEPPPGYVIEKWVGAGGMGEVYLAYHKEQKRRVAIKVVIPRIASTDKGYQYFKREMLVHRDLRHPNIVSFYGMILNRGQFQMVMEYVEGPNAADYMEKLGKPVPMDLCVNIGIQLMRALAHAHKKEYVHRDIKPSNIILSGSLQNPQVKLTDFGLAKKYQSSGLLGFCLTKEGDFAGSVGFTAPEQIRDFSEVKESADIYGAGATLYYMLTGKYPFLNFDARRPDAFLMVLEHPPVPIRAYRPDIPDALDKIIRKALEKQPERRWATAGEMANALKPFLDAPVR